MKTIKKAASTNRDMFVSGLNPRPKRQLNKKVHANELDGKTWTRYSISVWSDIRKTREDAAVGHPAMFPVELPRRLIRIFTRQKSSLVLDPFAGTGSTIVAAQELGRKAVGLEIAEEYCSIAVERLKQPGLFDKSTGDCVIHSADARDLLKLVRPASADLCITSPPYWNILLQKRTADYKKQRDYGDHEADLGKIRDYDQFLRALKEIFEGVFVALRPGAYCCVNVMDLRKKDRFYPYHSDVANFMQGLGFTYDDIIIWDRRHEYNNMRPLGYPFVFRVNKAHEYILVFLKPKGTTVGI